MFAISCPFICIDEHLQTSCEPGCVYGFQHWLNVNMRDPEESWGVMFVTKKYFCAKSELTDSSKVWTPRSNNNKNSKRLLLICSEMYVLFPSNSGMKLMIQLHFIKLILISNFKWPEGWLRTWAGVHSLLAWFPVSIHVSEAANQTIRFSHIFGLVSREEKKKPFIQSEAVRSRATAKWTRKRCVYVKMRPASL